MAVSQSDAAPAIRVTALQPMRRRAGMAFTSEPVTIAGGEFDAEQLLRLAEPLQKNAYGQYLLNLANAK